jgi:hypothetical protein
MTSAVPHPAPQTPLRSYLRLTRRTFGWVATVTGRSVRTCQKWEVDRPVPPLEARKLVAASDGGLRLADLRPDLWGDEVASRTTEAA